MQSQIQTKHTETAKQKPIQQGLTVKLTASGVIIMLFVLTCLMVYFNSQIIEKKYEISGLKKTKANLEKSAVNTEIKVSELSSLSRVEQKAREYGMTYPDKIRFISLKSADFQE